MDNKNKNAVNVMAISILDAIDIYVNKLQFDQTYKGIITSRSLPYYDVSFLGRTFKCASLDNKTYAINDVVYVRIPCNDWSEAYIEGKVGSS